MKKVFTFLAAIIVSSFAINAQETTLQESWSGEINVGTRKLHIGFNFQALSDGKQACTMDVPDQGAKDIPVEIIKNDTDSLNISIAALRAKYKGRKTSKESIEGQFTQNGMTLALNLKPGKFELIRPQTPNPPYPYATEEVTFKNEAEGAELSGTLGEFNLQMQSNPNLLTQDSTKQIIHRHLLLNNPTMLAIRYTKCSNHRQMHGLTGG